MGWRVSVSCARGCTGTDFVRPSVDSQGERTLHGLWYRGLDTSLATFLADCVLLSLSSFSALLAASET